MADINITTVQGIGDIFWVYQKLAPYYDKINLRVLMTTDSEVQRRSAEWVKMWPKVGSVEFKVVSCAEYDAVMDARPHLPLPETDDYIPYCMNLYLEEGIRLDEIDPGMKVEWNVPIKTDIFPPSNGDILNYKPLKDYIVLYVSGATKQLCPVLMGAWGYEEYYQLLNKLYQRYKINLPVILIGANYDRETILGLAKYLVERNFEVHQYIQFPPAQVLHLIKKSKLFIGFQSGLNILADNFDVKQIMIYYNTLREMSYTWCKRENIKTVFHAYTFFNEIDEIVESLPDGFLAV